MNVVVPDDDERHMRRALELAMRGLGRVEPNPLVGSVVVQAGEVVGEGWHQVYGEAHAEVHALRAAAEHARGATLYVSLEPCCHQGKTPPCTDAILAAGIARVVIGTADCFPQVAGQGIARLQAAGIPVTLGVCRDAADDLIAPFRKRVVRGRPWVLAKWAMTLDGKLATHTGDSQWISNSASRALVHELRGRVDGILVGSGTALHDNPQLTARPPGPRTALRIVFDSQLRLLPDSHLAQTATQVPVLIATSTAAPRERQETLRALGCEVLPLPAADRPGRMAELLDELGRRGMTNLLVEGGGGVLGALFDLGEIDEVHAFIAPKLIGGKNAISPLGGQGVAEMFAAQTIDSPQIRTVDQDLYVSGRVRRTCSPEAKRVGSA